MIESVNQIDFRSEDFKEFKKDLGKKISNQTIEEKAEIEQISLRIRLEKYVESDNLEIQSVGDFLIAFFKKIGVRQTRIAAALNIRASNLNKIFKGDRRLNMILAVQIGEIIDIDPNLLIQVQAKNELSNILKIRRAKVKNYKDLIKE